jgi:hypothetical protein
VGPRNGRPPEGPELYRSEVEPSPPQCNHGANSLDATAAPDRRRHRLRHDDTATRSRIKRVDASAGVSQHDRDADTLLGPASGPQAGVIFDVPGVIRGPSSFDIPYRCDRRTTARSADHEYLMADIFGAARSDALTVVDGRHARPTNEIAATWRMSIGPGSISAQRAMRSQPARPSFRALATTWWTQRKTGSDPRLQRERYIASGSDSGTLRESSSRTAITPGRCAQAKIVGPGVIEARCGSGPGSHGTHDQPYGSANVCSRARLARPGSRPTTRAGSESRRRASPRSYHPARHRLSAPR